LRIAEAGEKEEEKRPKKQDVRAAATGYILTMHQCFFSSSHTQAAHNHWRIVELRPFSLFYTRVEYLYIIKGETTTAGVKS